MERKAFIMRKSLTKPLKVKESKQINLESPYSSKIISLPKIITPRNLQITQSNKCLVSKLSPFKVVPKLRSFQPKKQLKKSILIRPLVLDEMDSNRIQIIEILDYEDN